MKNLKVKSYEKNQKELEPNVWKDAKEFYRDNFGKVWHLLPNIYGEDEPKGNFHNNPKIAECKRVSYRATNEGKKIHRDYIDRIVIDADEGVYPTLTKMRGLIRALNFEYWIIAGTDKPEKPADSGSIVIMFQPLRATEENKKRFKNLMRCLNLSVGDPLNTGYAHKSPEWKGTTVKEKIPGSILNFDHLYNGVLKYYKHTADEVDTLFMEKKKCEYDKKFDAELQKGEDELNINALCNHYNNSHKTEEQTALIQLFRNDTEKRLRIGNRTSKGEVLVKDKRDYMKRLIFQEELFNDSNYIDPDTDYTAEYYQMISIYPKSECGTLEEYLDYIRHNKFVKPISFRGKFNVSESEEKYWYKKVMDKLKDEFFFETNISGDKSYENFVLYKRKNENIQWLCRGLGFTEEEVNFILKWAKNEREGIRTRTKVKRNKKRERVMELNKLKRIYRASEEEIEELRKLVEPKNKKDELRLNRHSNMGDNDMKILYNTNDGISEISENKKSKKKERITYYVDELNFVMVRDYVVENYFGGNDTNLDKKIKPYGIRKISQSELLQNYKSYGMNTDLYVEMFQLSHFHKKLNVGNQLKPSKK
jgi:hypothetical protein